MTLLDVYFIFILDYRNDIRQNANSSSFLESKMGHKAVETSHNINNVFGPGTASECTVQWWFKKFCKGDESLEGEQWLAIKSWQQQQLSAVIKADSLTTTWEAAEELSVNHSTVIWHLKQIGEVRKLDKWVPHELTKNCHFAVSSLTLGTAVNHFSIGVMTSSAVGPRRSSKALPKAKLVPRKCRGHCLVVCCPSDPLELSES